MSELVSVLVREIGLPGGFAICIDCWNAADLMDDFDDSDMNADGHIVERECPSR